MGKCVHVGVCVSVVVVVGLGGVDNKVISYSFKGHL